MRINGIELKSFRNFASETVSFSDGVNIIYGANAAGKTNLLEAIFYFASAKSFRGCKEREAVRFGAEEADIKMRYSDNLCSYETEISFNKDGKKSFYRNGIKATKLSEYLGMFRAVIFTPDHLNLVKGAPEARRRFIDLAICQSFPRYVASLNEYNKLLSQKNALLKGTYPPEQKKMLMEVYNERMAVLAAIITVNRNKYIEHLSEKASEIHAEMTDGSEKREELTIDYFSQIGDNRRSQDDIKIKYSELFEEKADMEISRCMTFAGPQKDDMRVKIDGRNARLYSSQGQQRTAVISMKLAEGELSNRLTGEYPVFLLDDVLSELDDKRKSGILEKITGKQVIITGCDGSLGCCAADKIRVDDGKITQ